jgi:hypothetical protein
MAKMFHVKHVCVPFAGKYFARPKGNISSRAGEMFHPCAHSPGGALAPSGSTQFRNHGEQGRSPRIAEFYSQLIWAVICVLPVSFPMVSVTVTGFTDAAQIRPTA